MKRIILLLMKRIILLLMKRIILLATIAAVMAAMTAYQGQRLPRLASVSSARPGYHRARLL